MTDEEKREEGRMLDLWRLGRREAQLLGGGTPFSSKQHVQSVEHNQPIEYSTMCTPNGCQRITAEPTTLPTPFNAYVIKDRKNQKLQAGY